jgi:hypothetical protein
MPKGRVHELKYLIEIPIPYVDKQGRKLEERRRSDWRRKLEALLSECFGGFTPGKAPALNRVRYLSGCLERP